MRNYAKKKNDDFADAGVCTRGAPVDPLLTPSLIIPNSLQARSIDSFAQTAASFLIPEKPSNEAMSPVLSSEGIRASGAKALVAVVGSRMRSDLSGFDTTADPIKQVR